MSQLGSRVLPDSARLCRSLAGDGVDQLREQVSGGTPHGLVVEFEKVDGDLSEWCGPELMSIRVGTNQFSEGQRENSLDFSCMC